MLALLIGALLVPVAAQAQPSDGTEWLPDQYRTPSVPNTQAVPRSAVCDGDGTGGKRVQGLYVRGDSQPDRYSQLVGQFQTFAAQIDDIFVEAANRLGGGVRHVRYVHDSACRAAIANVVIPQSSMATVDTITSAIQARGYNRADRKYLVWYDKDGCGLAFGNGGDERPGADNPYNAGPHYATVGTGCWSWQASGHELLHNFGAVNGGGPHATSNGHCWDDEDIMCYNDGGIPNPPGQLVKVCPGAPENQVDCLGDDYFNTNPFPGSYLGTHWNTANSQYLIRGGSTYPVGQIKGVAGKCVDDDHSNTADGTAIQLWTCNQSQAQWWTRQNSTLRAFGKCMDVQLSGTANGTVVQLYTCNGSGAQVWQAQGNGTLRNPQSGRCLTTSNGSTGDGARLVISDCTAAANQIWTF